MNPSLGLPYLLMVRSSRWCLTRSWVCGGGDGTHSTTIAYSSRAPFSDGLQTPRFLLIGPPSSRPLWHSHLHSQPQAWVLRSMLPWGRRDSLEFPYAAYGR